MNRVTVFRSRKTPEPVTLAGYAALVDRYALRVPLPPRLAAISARSRPKRTPEWLLFTPKHARPDTLAGHLEFALKWEGVDLGVLNALFREIPSSEIANIVTGAPTGAYARRLWFLYEWLTEQELDVPDPGKVRAVPALDAKHQYGIAKGELSSRHKVRDNLPGTRAFCPLVHRTNELQSLQNLQLDGSARDVLAAARKRG